MNARMPAPEGVIRMPHSGRFVAWSLVCAFCINILPWQGALVLIRPDALLLLLLYWCLHKPREIGLASAFFAGILMDGAYGALFGQHALVYTLCAFLALRYRLRILAFGPFRQALHVFPVLALGQGLMLLLNLVIAAPFPGYAYFLGSVAGAALWAPLTWLLDIARMQPAKPDPSL